VNAYAVEMGDGTYVYAEVSITIYFLLFAKYLTIVSTYAEFYRIISYRICELRMKLDWQERTTPGAGY
jgi:hypothetical protein